MKTFISHSLLSLIALLALCTLPGCGSDDDAAGPAPEASFTVTPATVAVGDTVFLSNTSRYANGYAWTFGDGTLSNEDQPILVYENADTYTITMIAYGDGGTDQARGEITVTERAPQASFEVADVDGLMASVPVIFTFTGSGRQAAYSWDFGDGGASALQDPVYTYQTAGSYTVALTVTTSGGTDTYALQINIAPAPASGPVLYFTDANEAKVYRLSGPGTANTLTEAFATTGYSIGLAYDSVSDKVYYTDDDNGTLVQVNSDGTGAVNVMTGLTAPRGVAVDEVNSLVYVVDRGGSAVLSYNTATTGTATVYDAITGLGELPVGVAIHEGQLYVTAVEIDSESIWKGATDGSGISNIINYSEGGYGYGVAVDRVNGRLYFDNYDTGNILSANLDGSGITTIAPTDGKAYGIAIDNQNGKVYWSTNTGTISRANLDGSQPEIIASGLNNPRGIFLTF